MAAGGNEVILGETNAGMDAGGDAGDNAANREVNGGINAGAEGGVNGSAAAVTGPDRGADGIANDGENREVDGEVGERTTSQLSREVCELGKLWEAQVRKNEVQRYPDQLRELLVSLGPLPPPGSPAARAIWYAALINPLPALGVAPEIRPAVLAATGDARQQLSIVIEGMKISLKYLSGHRRRLWRCRAAVLFVALLLIYMLVAPEIWPESITGESEASADGGVLAEGIFMSGTDTANIDFEDL